VKERPIAFKLGIGFCDHNHERKEPLAGYLGMLNFAKEVYASVASPVWQFAPRRANRAAVLASLAADPVFKPEPKGPKPCGSCGPLESADGQFIRAAKISTPQEVLA
jgi:nitrogenase molybdenum-cofactor synthesis protein NifE